MAARRYLLSLVALVFSPALLLAQDLTQPEVENAKHRFAGVVTANAVYVRSGPGENYYPTMKLDSGAELTVVGIKYDWLKILPPEGSFSYVPKNYVSRDGDTGTLLRTALVKAGSDLIAIKQTVQTKLEKDATVEIVGEQDEYYKITPPEGAYLYINKRFVDPVRKLDDPSGVADEGSEDPSIDPRVTIPDEEVADAGETEPTTRPAEEIAAVEPTTKPAAAFSVDFQKLEAEFASASEKPVAEQPIEQLLAGYEALMKKENLSSTSLQIADARIQALKVRAEARDNFVAVQKAQEEMQARQQALKAEQEELEERIRQKDISLYTAVGTLRPSSLQQGGETLYRLTDPNTGRTLVYVRTSDPQYISSIDQFVGVRGEISMDTQLDVRVINPVAIEPVDQSKVNGTVAAQIVPPSLLPRASQASTAEE